MVCLCNMKTHCIKNILTSQSVRSPEVCSTTQGPTQEFPKYILQPQLQMQETLLRRIGRMWCIMLECYYLRALLFTPFPSKKNIPRSSFYALRCKSQCREYQFSCSSSSNTDLICYFLCKNMCQYLIYKQVFNIFASHLFSPLPLNLKNVFFSSFQVPMAG